jgi:hypothetical protein
VSCFKERRWLTFVSEYPSDHKNSVLRLGIKKVLFINPLKRRNVMKTRMMILIATLLITASSVFAAPLEQIYYSKSTTLAFPKVYVFRLSLYDDPDVGQGSLFWQEEKTISLTSAKLFTYLGDTVSLSGVDFSQQLYVQVERKKSDGTYKIVGTTTRDMLPVVPYALWSATAGGGGAVTSVTSGDGLTGGGTGDVTLNVVGGAGITVNPDSIAVDTNAIQARVTGTCPAGQHLNGVNANGTVNCTADANSGGTVTNVATGAGLTGGPITTTGTISIATGGVTSAMIADGTVTSADVNANSIQVRVTGTCPAGQHISGINANGTVSCAADAGAGRLLSQFYVNRDSVTNGLSGYYNMYTNYTPSENVRVFVWERCTFDASSAGAILAFRGAYRSPSGTGSVVQGPSYEMAVETAAANQWVTNTAIDSFDLAAGVSYDFGIYFVQTSPSGGGSNDFCTLNAQVFSR